MPFASLRLLVILFTACLPTSEPGTVSEESTGVLFDEPKYRGVCWVGGRTPVEEEDFLPLVENHVSWIVQTPFGWQPKHDSPELRFITESSHVFWARRTSDWKRRPAWRNSSVSRHS